MIVDRGTFITHGSTSLFLSEAKDKDGSSLPLFKRITLDDIEQVDRTGLHEAEYIAIYKKAHPELEANEKKLVSEAKKSVTRFKPTKLIGFNAQRVEHTYFNEKGKRIAFIQERKRKPYTMDVKILPNKPGKNPEKQLLASIGEFPHKTQIFRYVNNPNDIYIASGTEFFKLDTDKLGQILLQVFHAMLSDDILIGKLLDADYFLQYMSKSKIPHLKLKDWRKSGRVTTMTMEDINKSFEEHLIERADERKDLGDYHKRKSMT